MRTLASNTSQPYQQLDNSTAKFTYTLQAGEKQSARVYFSIHDNVTDFYITMTFQPSNFLMKSDSLDDTNLSYQQTQDSGNYTWRTNPPPP